MPLRVGRLKKKTIIDGSVLAVLIKTKRKMTQAMLLAILL
jgi:hypothetical protein